MPTPQEYAEYMRRQAEEQAAAQRQAQQQNAVLGAAGAYGLNQGINALGSAIAPAATTPAITNMGQLDALSTAGEGATGAGMGLVGNALAGAGILHGGYNLANNFGKGDAKSGAVSGAEMGAGIGAFAGAPFIGAGIGALAGGLLGMAKSGKHKDQLARDQVRGAMQQKGMVDEDFNLTLADGSKFNIGVDGGARDSYEFSGGRRPYEVKTESPFAVQAVAWADPIAHVLTGFNKKLSTDFAGYFANAAMSNASSIEGVRANVLKMMEGMGINRQGLEEAIKAAAIDDGMKQAYLNSINTLFSGKGYYEGSWDDFVAKMNPQPATPSPNVPSSVADTKAPDTNLEIKGPTPNVGEGVNLRSRTRSPGIDLQGRRVNA